MSISFDRPDAFYARATTRVAIGELKNAFIVPVLSLPGDGREHGLILAILYRLLDCNFTRMPKGDLSEEQFEKLGIKDQDVGSFNVLRTLIEEMPKKKAVCAADPCGSRDELVEDENSRTASAGKEATEFGSEDSEPSVPPYFLPPTLATLVGFRGLLLHRSYLKTTAAAQCKPPEAIDVENYTCASASACAKADDVLLSRLLALFYWPGIMSRMK